jgi:hypothetical protein
MVRNTCFMYIHSNFEINIYFDLKCGIHIDKSHKYDTLQNHMNTNFNSHSKIHRSYGGFKYSIRSDQEIVYVHNDMALESKHT